MAAALSIKIRTGVLLPAERDQVVRQFDRMAGTTLVILAVTHDHFREAARLAHHAETGLRAGDALHLAIAAGHGATLCTLDKRLAVAGPPLGIATTLV